MTKRAGIYGGSLYELAKEEGRTEELTEQLLALRQIFRENPAYLSLLQEPSIPFAERARLIDEAFGASVDRYLTNFIKILVERGLLTEFGGCCEEYLRRYDVEHGISRAEVTSAVPLTDAELAALKEKLEARSGKKVILSARVDERVVGGIRVDLDGRRLDGTVRSRVQDLAKRISESTVTG